MQSIMGWVRGIILRQCDGYFILFRPKSMKHVTPKVTAFARAMRREPSAAENRLWQYLRNRQLDGLKFVRQEPIGPFIADFVCRSSKLVIEVDGPSHDEAAAYDERRSAFMARQGYRVLRILNDDALGDLHPVFETIKAAAK